MLLCNYNIYYFYLKKMSEKLITRILDYAIKEKASDIHLAELFPLSFRINWELIKLPDSSIISKEKVDIIISELLNWDKRMIEDFMNNRDIDFAYLNDDGTSFRVNWFFKMGRPAFVMRRIEQVPLTVEKLWLPKWAWVLPTLKQWLILVTWPTWSGKSTTMVAILEQINKTRKEHVITIEDPIEFVFKNKESIFSQRELWRDTESFHSALRAAMREDPDIVMVWEMRDKETVEAALELAETGHLVISTLHTSSAVQTIIRLLSFFPIDSQNAVSEKIASSLQWVISQRLIPKADWQWRVWIYELMIANTWIVNQIRMWKINQMQSSIETWARDWMVTMKKFADNLNEEWIINKKDYENYFKKEDSI